LTEKIYLKDSYIKEIEASITSIDGNKITLDKTIFYPVGGGEPCDTGKIELNNHTYNVIEVKKSDDEVVHLLDNVAGLSIGDKVHCKIDWEKRYAYMKFHTALHVIDAVLIRSYTNGKITGGQIYETKARADFDITGFDKQAILKLIDETQKVIDEGHDVYVKFLSKEEAQKIPNLARTEPGEELLKNLDVVRIIEIDGLDFQLDGGMHVANTKEIGKLKLLNYENKGSHRKRVEITIS